ncbi:hypothetical protein BJ741DRAFT_644770 [Chytriomyces cf. hyalinus JEL632]|nr:hypothetical protein BJ741DRAFT_597980 [Chytriomyces cf. hyalinus JEL632]KAI8845349.1 hypothetical protein BJ741DRAFT_644770 [Chytriomyces cf. hyalinus JEL632]
MPALRIVPVVKKYKSQKLDGANQLPTIEFDGRHDELKQALWELAKPHIKGLARVVENELELDRTEQTIDQISDFVVISRSSRSYTFGEVATPVFSINEDLSNITKRGVVESLTTFIYAYSRHLTKVGDYERVKDLITGGAAARDRAGAPNQNRWVEIVSRLREIHTGLVGEDMVWNSWAGMLLQNQETLEERIVMPPPPEVTILFERQSHTSQQLHHIKHSLRIALDVVEEQEANVKSLKRSIDYAVLDLKNQMQQQQRNLTAHRRAIQHVLNAVTPEETAAAASTFDSVENILDDDHSVGTWDGDNELWSDAVDRED